MTTQGTGLDPHAVPSAIDLHNNNLRLIRMRWVAGAVMLCFALGFILIPVVVGFITLRQRPVPPPPPPGFNEPLPPAS